MKPRSRKLGFCSISALDRPLAAAAELAAKAGLDGLEVTARPPHLDPDAGPESARAAGNAVRASGIEVIAYGSYLGRPGRTDPDCAAREAEIAGALGTKLLRVWAEPIEGRGDDLEPVVGWLRAACDAADERGVTVVVERHLGSFADTLERIERLFSEVKRENLALNYQVLDLLAPSEAPKQAGDAARLAGPARYFHLKNYRQNPDAGGPLLPGGSLAGGALDYRAILRAALDAGYAGPLTLEFLSFEPMPVEEKLAADVAHLESLLAEIDGSD